MSKSMGRIVTGESIGSLIAAVPVWHRVPRSIVQKDQLQNMDIALLIIVGLVVAFLFIAALS